MTYAIEGDYFEGCNCDLSCNCIYLAPATREHCEVFFAWRINRGAKDGVDLGGLNVAMAARSGKVMTDGGWKVGLYIDQRASAAQTKALGEIFGGKAGGHLANVAPLIGEVVGVQSAPISFDKNGKKATVHVGDVLDLEVTELVGGDGQSPVTLTNAPLGAVTQPLRQGRADRIRYSGPWRTEVTGSNGFLADFRYEAK